MLPILRAIFSTSTRSILFSQTAIIASFSLQRADSSWEPFGDDLLSAPLRRLGRPDCTYWGVNVLAPTHRGPITSQDQPVGGRCARTIFRLHGLFPVYYHISGLVALACNSPHLVVYLQQDTQTHEITGGKLIIKLIGPLPRTLSAVPHHCPPPYAQLPETTSPRYQPALSTGDKIPSKAHFMGKRQILSN